MTDLEDRLARLEERVFAPPRPSTQAATDAYGNPGTVVAGEIIESAWGNSVRDHVTRIFPDRAALETWAAPNGAIAHAPAGVPWIRLVGVWRAYGVRLLSAIETTTGSGPYTTSGYTQIPGLTINFTGRADRYYRATLIIPHIQQTTATGPGHPAIAIMNSAGVRLNTSRTYLPPSGGSTLTVVTIFQQTGTDQIKGVAANETAGTSDIVADAYSRNIFMVEDIGNQEPV